MRIDELTVGIVQTRCYILSREEGQECLVIDPGDEAERIRKAAGERRIAAILLTHGHFDHIGAVRELCESSLRRGDSHSVGDSLPKSKDMDESASTAAYASAQNDTAGGVRELCENAQCTMHNAQLFLPKIIIHELDAPMMGNPVLNASIGLIGRKVTAPAATDTVKEGDELEIAGLKVKVLHTPGHTPGSVCYLIEGELFTGDTMFEYGWGRTDLPGGNEEQMMQSLRRLEPMVRSMPMHAGH